MTFLLDLLSFQSIVSVLFYNVILSETKNLILIFAVMRSFANALDDVGGVFVLPPFKSN